MDTIETGDVVLLSSVTPFAILVKWAINSIWNHVAIAARIDKSKLPEIIVVPTGGTLCLIEFNGDDITSVLTNRIHHGNRLIEFEDMLDKYKMIGVRKIKPEF